MKLFRKKLLGETEMKTTDHTSRVAARHIAVPAVLAALFLFPAGAEARPISGAEAEKAALNWLSSHKKFSGGGANAPVAESSVRTREDGDGTALFHAVETDTGVTVVLSAESRIVPVVAVLESGAFDVDGDNPLAKILAGDMALRMAQLPPEAAPAGKAAAGGASDEEREWATLLGDAAAGPKAYRLTLSDVRVSPLVQSKWDQEDVGSTWCYNYYTPNHYVCGCVATATAQIMRYWTHPTAEIQPITRPCYVDETPTSRTSLGGTFAWSSMPLVPSTSATTAQRQAIGHLCYDVGVSVYMDWTSTESGSSGYLVPDALTGVFGYANAFCCTRSDYGSTTAAFSQNEIQRAIWAGLDAGCPSAIGIYGHEVVADGYGYQSGTAYTHLNMGWSGTCDVWYNLPTVDASNGYSSTALDEVAYNIHPSKSGDLLTGRVLHSSGSPVSGASVSASNGSTTYSATTGANGIYALWVDGGRTYTVTAASGSSTASKAVYVTKCVSEGIADNLGSGTIGNSWGNDISLTAPVTPLPDLAFHAAAGWPEPAYLAKSTADTTPSAVFETGDEILLKFCYANAGAAAAGSHALLAVVKDSEGAEVYRWTWTRASLAAGAHVEETDISFSLPAGSYTATVTLDPEGSVAESDESDNVWTRAFAVSGTEPPDPGSDELQDAVDNYSLEFSTGGDADWHLATDEAFNDGDSARSGDIGDFGYSCLDATGASGAGIVSFRWKVSSEQDCDIVEFYVDGELKLSRSGTGSGWRHEAFRIEAGGDHWFEWLYFKDGSASGGSDCAWVDQVKWTPDSPLAPVYRFYSSNYKGHFFTMSEDEMLGLIAGNPNWRYEGVAYFACPEEAEGTTGLYRFYSKKYRGHFYTTDYDEYWTVRYTNPNWNYEGIAYYVRPSSGDGAMPVYRFWSKGYKHHFYTTDYDEYLTVRYTNPNWNYEGIAFYAWAEPDDLPEGF